MDILQLLQLLGFLQGLIAVVTHVENFRFLMRRLVEVFFHQLSVKKQKIRWAAGEN